MIIDLPSSTFPLPLLKPSISRLTNLNPSALNFVAIFSLFFSCMSMGISCHGISMRAMSPWCLTLLFCMPICRSMASAFCICVSFCGVTLMP